MARPADGPAADRPQLSVRRAISDADKMVSLGVILPNTRNRTTLALAEAQVQLIVDRMVRVEVYARA